MRLYSTLVLASLHSKRAGSTLVSSSAWVSYHMTCSKFMFQADQISCSHVFLQLARSHSLTRMISLQRMHTRSTPSLTGVPAAGPCHGRRQSWPGRVAAREPSDADPTSVKGAVWLGLSLSLPTPPPTLWKQRFQTLPWTKVLKIFLLTMLCIIVFYGLLRKWV
jgi:hypothetical protein